MTKNCLTLYRYIFPKLFHSCTTDSYAWLCFHNGMLNFKSVGVHFVIGIHTGNIFSLCLAYTQVQRTDKIMTILNHNNTFIIIRTDNITSIVCGTIIYYNAFEVFKWSANNVTSWRTSCWLMSCHQNTRTKSEKSWTCKRRPGLAKMHKEAALWAGQPALQDTQRDRKSVV